MKNSRKKNLWYNPKDREARAAVWEGGEALGMNIERLAQSEEGRSLLATYCRVYTTVR